MEIEFKGDRRRRAGDQAGAAVGVLTMSRGLGGARLRAASFGLGAVLALAAVDAAAARSVATASVAHGGATGDLTSTTMADAGESGDATAGDGVFTAEVPAYPGELPRYQFTYTLTAPAVDEVVSVGTTPTTLHINELMASNSGTVLDPQGDDDDWIELFNSGLETIDLGGMYLSDKTSEPLKWRFPADASIPAGGYLLVWADDDDGASPGLHTNFKLSAGGEHVVLSDVDARDNTVIDQVEFPALDADVSYGRSPEGTGPFAVQEAASPGAAAPIVPELSITADGPVTEGGTATFTVDATLTPTANLQVTLSVTQGEGQDYLGTDLPTSVTIAAGARQAILRVPVPDDAVDEPDGVLTATLASGDGYTVGTPGSASLAVRDDDGNAPAVVVINELMASNGTTAADPQGEHDDWIELYNNGAAAVDLGGKYLSDRRAKPTKWQIPAGTSIPGGGFLVVWADDDEGDSPGLHAGFKLSAGGESVVLSDTDANGNALLDVVDFPALERDQSYGRVPDGTGAFRRIGGATPGAAAATTSDATLAELSLSGVDFGAFAPDTLTYRATVQHAVASTAVTARVNTAAASLAITPADAAPEAGHQVALAVGETIIAVAVTAENGSQRTYQVTVDRAPAPPVASLSAAAGVTEGAPVVVTATLDRAPAADLELSLDVIETGGYLAAPPPATFTVTAGSTQATLSLNTDDDTVAEDDGSVTVTLAAGVGYDLGTTTSVTVAVADNDTVELALAAEPSLIEEGGSAGLTLSIANGTTFAADRTVTFTATGLAADAHALEPSSAVLAAGTSSLAATFTALENDAAEAPRTVRVEATADTGETASAELAVEDAGPGPTVAGFPQVGSVLTAEPSDAEGYQWLRDGEPIAGATSASHAVAEADVDAALSVAATARGRTRTSAATQRVWPAPSSPPLAAGEEELVGTTLTLGRAKGTNLPVFGYSRSAHLDHHFGAVDEASTVGGRELELFAANRQGASDSLLALQTSPPLGAAEAAGLTAYWNGYATEPLSPSRLLDGVWTGPSGLPFAYSRRLVAEPSDGLRVAVSLRRALPAATVSASSDGVAEGAAAVFEVALDKAPWSARTVSLAVTADGAALSDEAPAEVGFAAGETVATLALATADDAVVSGDGTVSVELLAGDGYALGAETSATVAVAEDDAAAFAVSASPASLDEGDSATVTVSVANGVTFAEDQPVALAATGTAAASDYTLAPTALTLSAGETSVAATLAAVRDGDAEPDETITVTARHGGADVGSATATIRANAAPPPPAATVTGPAAAVAEGATLSFAVSLDAAPFAPVAVAVSVAETGATLSDTPPSSVRFAIGERTLTLTLATADDSVVEADSTVTVRLLAGDGYALGAASSATATVRSDDAAVFEVSADASEIDEGGSATVAVSVANGATFAEAQSIALVVSGTAAADDYDLAPNPLALDAGASSAEAVLAAVDDTAEEPAETVVVSARHDGADVGTATVTIRASDIPSDDAALASLALSGVDIGAFSPERTEYSASVETEVASTTVTAAANDAAASLEIADASGSTQGGTRTVSLEEGGNTVAVTVTAEDGTTVRAYRVSVERAYAAAWGERLPARDVELGSGAQPTGLWSDGETLWVVRDWRAGSVAAYRLSDGAPLADLGYALGGGLSFPVGLWSDGETLWVADQRGGVTGHRLSDGSRVETQDVALAADNTTPTGLWSNGETLWVADEWAWKAFAYRLSDKVRAAVVGAGPVRRRRHPGEPDRAVVGRGDGAGDGLPAQRALRLPAVGRRVPGGALGGRVPQHRGCAATRRVCGRTGGCCGWWTSG